MEFRFINDIKRPGPENMALDEVMLDEISKKKSLPSLRIYGWLPKALTIGYFQSISKEIDEETAQRNEVPVVRRMTGGGAILHDNEMTYTIIIPEDSRLIPDDIIESFKIILMPIVKALNANGIIAEFHPINDLIVDGKKISGSAQTRKKGCILQHGTIILDVDVEDMFSYLKIPDEKLKDKAIKNAKERVTSVKAELNKNNIRLDENIIEKIKSDIKSEYEKSLDISFEDSRITKEEIEKAKSLADNKYAIDEWNKQR